MSAMMQRMCWMNTPMKFNVVRLREDVIRKCRGVPFVAVCLGLRVHQENDRSKWTAILHGENWDSTGHLIGALRLSYVQLDSHLKPCFAYSSVVPQNFLFEEEWLIQHWMAQGFIQPNPNESETIEDTARSYFRSLVGRSFFQTAHVDRTGERQSYSLSEMMRDLAIHVSGEDCKCSIIDGPYNIPEKVRYLTVVFNMLTSQDMFEVISGGKRLHTLIVVGGSDHFELKIPIDIGQRFIRLRALDLGNFCVTELPESIGELKHLRCLQLRNTKIRRLPESICDLYSLQTLGLTNCYYLEKFPCKIKNLRMMRHIDLVMARNGCRLEGMPKGIGLLIDLQTLSRFVVSSNTHKGNIAELGKLNKLRGELLISNLHLVESVQEAVLANLASKQFLQKLELSWSGNSKNAENILEHLKPPTKVKELTISGYTGMACPSWLGSSVYTNLVTVCLYDFKSCTELPPLGLLPALKNLHLKGWESLVYIDCSRFCGRSTPSFEHLEKLHLEMMDRLQLWDGDERCAFPKLLELVLENCCRLEQVSHSLPSLAKVTVEGSPNFRGLRSYPALKHLNVNASGEWIWGSWRSLSCPISVSLCKLPTVEFPSGLGRFHTCLQRLEISHCEQLVSIPEDWPPCNLSHLSVRHCPRLHELPRGIRRLKALEDMEIIACGQLACLPEMDGLTSLLRLEISDCGLIRSLPDKGLPSSVRVLSINSCPLLASSCLNEGRSAHHIKMNNILVWIDGREVPTSAR
ncbi:putative disease resistance protein RGA3 isoform X2 [Panicum hallii]|uniref:putative disease resistance protein RGA3 isoform X2 n=1 Tax=Panicum hallii TaxID=206008 RepID=UPI000DF4DF70|nr:putative disease resistance protein RGA3 isoform X2 [Panicum hallii]